MNLKFIKNLFSGTNMLIAINKFKCRVGQHNAAMVILDSRTKFVREPPIFIRCICRRGSMFVPLFQSYMYCLLLWHRTSFLLERKSWRYALVARFELQSSQLEPARSRIGLEPHKTQNPGLEPSSSPVELFSRLEPAHVESSWAGAWLKLRRARISSSRVNQTRVRLELTRAFLDSNRDIILILDFVHARTFHC